MSPLLVVCAKLTALQLRRLLSSARNARKTAPKSETEQKRLGKLCGNGPDLWLNLQKRYDLHHALQELGETIKKIPTLELA